MFTQEVSHPNTYRKVAEIARHNSGLTVSEFVVLNGGESQSDFAQYNSTQRKVIIIRGGYYRVSLRGVYRFRPSAISTATSYNAFVVGSNLLGRVTTSYNTITENNLGLTPIWVTNPSGPMTTTLTNGPTTQDGFFGMYHQSIDTYLESGETIGMELIMSSSSSMPNLNLGLGLNGFLEITPIS